MLMLVLQSDLGLTVGWIISNSVLWQASIWPRQELSVCLQAQVWRSDERNSPSNASLTGQNYHNEAALFPEALRSELLKH